MAICPVEHDSRYFRFSFFFSSALPPKPMNRSRFVLFDCRIMEFSSRGPRPGHPHPIRHVILLRSVFAGGCSVSCLHDDGVEGLTHTHTFHRLSSSAGSRAFPVIGPAAFVGTKEKAEETFSKLCRIVLKLMIFRMVVIPQCTLDDNKYSPGLGFVFP